METERNNWTGQDSVHGQVKPKSWQLMLEWELTGKSPC
jgi:hypothetical protein